MALDTTAATAVAEAICVATIDSVTGPLIAAHPEMAADLAAARASSKTNWVSIITEIFNGIKTNAVIDPNGGPPRMTAGAANVVGSGKIT